MDALGINPGYLLMQIALFGILFLVMKGYLYEPILKALEDRKAKIAKGLEDARQAAIARDNADAEAKKVLDEARAEAAKMRQDAATQAEETASGILAKANEDAKAVVANASAGAEEERNRILAGARDQIAAIAIAAANKLVGQALDEKRQRELVAQFFAQVPADVAGMVGETAEVTSALPLTDAEQANVKGTLKAANVAFKVNPAILGGLIVRVGDKVVDNSVAAQMSAMRDALK
ncbi:MAG: F0F1 ATP synthase subunit B [Anaerolineales bacterium]|nr:F0F1 ATP synthase subunit B [Anaerolineales bacterium]